MLHVTTTVVNHVGTVTDGCPRTQLQRATQDEQDEKRVCNVIVGALSIEFRKIKIELVYVESIEIN